MLRSATGFALRRRAPTPRFSSNGGRSSPGCRDITRVGTSNFSMWNFSLCASRHVGLGYEIKVSSVICGFVLSACYYVESNYQIEMFLFVCKMPQFPPPKYQLWNKEWWWPSENGEFVGGGCARARVCFVSSFWIICRLKLQTVKLISLHCSREAVASVCA